MFVRKRTPRWIILYGVYLPRFRSLLPGDLCSPQTFHRPVLDGRVAMGSGAGEPGGRPPPPRAREARG